MTLVKVEEVTNQIGRADLPRAVKTGCMMLGRIDFNRLDGVGRVVGRLNIIQPRPSQLGF